MTKVWIQMNNGNTKVKCGYGVPISNPVARKISHLEAETITKHRKCEKFLATGFEFAYTALYIYNWVEYSAH